MYKQLIGGPLDGTIVDIDSDILYYRMPIIPASTLTPGSPLEKEKVPIAIYRDQGNAEMFYEGLE